MITLASYAKQNLNLANLKYGKDNLLFITLKHTPFDHKYNILFAGIYSYICYFTIVFRTLNFHK